MKNFFLQRAALCWLAALCFNNYAAFAVDLSDAAIGVPKKAVVSFQELLGILKTSGIPFSVENAAVPREGKIELEAGSIKIKDLLLKVAAATGYRFELGNTLRFSDPDLDQYGADYTLNGMISDLDCKNLTASEIVKEISEQSKISIVSLALSSSKSKPRFSYHFKNISIRDALDAVANTQGVGGWITGVWFSKTKTPKSIIVATFGP